MSNLSSPRTVRLLDARAPGRPFVAAELYREITTHETDPRRIQEATKRLTDLAGTR